MVSAKKQLELSKTQGSRLKIKPGKSFKSIVKQLNISSNTNLALIPLNLGLEGGNLHEDRETIWAILMAMLQELQRLDERISQIPGSLPPMSEAIEYLYADSPFSDHINLEELPKHFHVPGVESYDGTSDPAFHEGQYKVMMMVVNKPPEKWNACMCRGFGSTLTGVAMKWFINVVPKKSINSFAELVYKFKQAFAHRVIRKKSLE